jgi:hypothetical protein
MVVALTLVAFWMSALLLSFRQEFWCLESSFNLPTLAKFPLNFRGLPNNRQRGSQQTYEWETHTSPWVSLLSGSPEGRPSGSYRIFSVSATLVLALLYNSTLMLVLSLSTWLSWTPRTAGSFGPTGHKLASCWGYGQNQRDSHYHSSSFLSTFPLQDETKYWWHLTEWSWHKMTKFWMM